MKHNERELPFLDQKLINMIFAGVYGRYSQTSEDKSFNDFLNLLYTLQDYNCHYRLETCTTLFPLFEETIGPMERNSEGTTRWLALGLAIKELYGMRSSTLKSLLKLISLPVADQQLERIEDDILIAWALRFDGYKYLNERNFDHQAAVSHYLQTGDWNISLLEQLTVFFLLQRFLYKWGGETLPKDSQHWRAFRSLFLLTYAAEAPIEYRHDEYYDKWEWEYQPYQAMYAAQIQSVHEATGYQSR